MRPFFDLRQVAKTRLAGALKKTGAIVKFSYDAPDYQLDDASLTDCLPARFRRSRFNAPLDICLSNSMDCAVLRHIVNGKFVPSVSRRRRLDDARQSESR